MFDFKIKIVKKIDLIKILSLLPALPLHLTNTKINKMDVTSSSRDVFVLSPAMRLPNFNVECPCHD